MKEIIQKSTAVLLALFLLLALLPMGASYAASAETSVDWLWPSATARNITSAFGYRVLDSGVDYHAGMDIGAAYNTPIRAAKSGVVMSGSSYHNTNTNTSTQGDDGTANSITLKHDDGTYSRYVHMLAHDMATPGQRVEQGETIGYVGATGKASGPHIHFSIGTSSDFTKNSTTLICPMPTNPEITGKTLNVTKTREHGWPTELTTYVFEPCTYLSQCTYYPTYMTVKMSTAAPLWSLPCSSETNPSSQKIVSSMPVGTQLTVTAVYKNTVTTEAHYWYKATTPDGKSGYVYAKNAADSRSYLDGDVVIDNPKYPSNPHTQGQAFPIEGDIRSNQNILTAVRGSILSGSSVYADNDCTVELSGKSFSLKGSAINTAMKFKSLPAGSYTYKVTVSLSNIIPTTERR